MATWPGSQFISTHAGLPGWAMRLSVHRKGSEVSNCNTGVLALHWCSVELPLQVLQSHAGFYIGTFSDEDGPISRESEEYFPTRQAAEAALASGTWTQKPNP